MIAETTAIIFALLGVVPGFSERDVPLSDSPERICANRHASEWEVSSREGALAISARPDQPDWDSLPSFLKSKSRRARKRMASHLSHVVVQDGYLVGIDNGEWGGSIEWYSPDGKESYVLAGGNPLGFAQQRDQILLLGGLAHLTIDEGYLHFLARTPVGAWKIASTLELPGSPKAFTVTAEGVLLFVTAKGVFVLEGENYRQIASADFAYLYPNSIVEIDGTIFVGMRYAVSRLSPGEVTYSETWLVPTDCLQLGWFGWGCECNASFFTVLVRFALAR